MIRKFYDAAAAEATASKYTMGPELSLSEVYSGPEPKTEEKPIPEEKKEEPKVEEKAEEKPVIVEEKKEEKVEEKKQEQPAAVATPDWKEVVKKQPRNEVLSLLEIDEAALNLSKELKADDFVNKLITYRKENGNLTPFIEAATKDWDKESHLDLLRDDLKKQYPNLSPEKFQILAKNRIDKRFMLDDTTPPDEAELAAVELETEGEKIRQQRKDEQKKFLDGVKPVDKSAETARVAQEQADATQKQLQQFSQELEANPSFAKLNTSKQISFGTKENVFNHEANPALIKELAVNPMKLIIDNFWEVKDGKEIFNVEKFSKVCTYALNLESIEDALINHGRSLGTKQISEKELENKTDKKDTSPKNIKKSLAKTFAEEGKPFTLAEMYGG